MVLIVDYGMGNLGSVVKALEKQGLAVRIGDRPDDIKKADALILPGVGAFGEAMQNLKKRSLIDALREHIQADKPFLGICLGLQLLFSGSEEAPGVAGLDIFPGKVLRFPNKLKVPHMGWNQIHKHRETPLLAGIPEGSYFYFVHSYYVSAPEEVIATTTEYGLTFVSSVLRGNLFASQFHPEKSQTMGLKILENFGASL